MKKGILKNLTVTILIVSIILVVKSLSSDSIVKSHAFGAAIVCENNKFLADNDINSRGATLMLVAAMPVLVELIGGAAAVAATAAAGATLDVYIASAELMAITVLTGFVSSPETHTNYHQDIAMAVLD